MLKRINYAPLYEVTQILISVLFWLFRESEWRAVYRADQAKVNVNLKTTICLQDRISCRQLSGDLSQLVSLNAVCRSQNYL